MIWFFPVSLLLGLILDAGLGFPKYFSDGWFYPEGLFLSLG